jgi:hypothetical protein
MSKVSATDMQDIVGSQLGIAGPVSGFGIHYKITGDTNVTSATPAVEVELDEKSLEKAEKKSGVTRTPKASHGMDSSSPAGKRQEQGDNMYANMFDKKKLTSAVEKGLSSRVGFVSRSNYRSAIGSPQINPLMRVKQRRMLQLRKTFDQIAARKKKSVPVNAESLPKATLTKMIEAALSTGARMTPIGSLEHAMKLAGYEPKGEAKKSLQQQNKQKKRQWALFVDPHMIPTGWAMD